MENKDLKGLIEVRKSIFKQIKLFFKEIFSSKNETDINQIKTFEEQFLSKEEQEQRRIKNEKDIEEANYYKEIFENPEKYFVLDDTSEEFIYENNDTIEKKEILSKEEFFKVYEKIKSEPEKIEELSVVDLLKVDALLKKEILIKSEEEINSLKIEETQKELKRLEEENKALIEELKNIKNKKN